MSNVIYPLTQEEAQIREGEIASVSPYRATNLLEAQPSYLTDRDLSGSAASEALLCNEINLSSE
jgi:hypothetical protein